MTLFHDAAANIGHRDLRKCDGVASLSMGNFSNYVIPFVIAIATSELPLECIMAVTDEPVIEYRNQPYIVWSLVLA